MLPSLATQHYASSLKNEAALVGLLLFQKSN